MAAPRIYTDEPRSTERDPEDFTLGCGQPPEGVTSGRVCARTGGQLSCQLCPDAPTYWGGMAVA